MCSICLEENDQKYIYTKGHTFYKEELCYTIKCECNIYIHEECLMLWTNKKNTCPICIQHIHSLENNDDIENKIRDELKELYLFEILIILILIQVNCLLFQSNHCRLIISLILLYILSMLFLYFPK